jgi:hypothetical protein
MYIAYQQCTSWLSMHACLPRWVINEALLERDIVKGIWSLRPQDDFHLLNHVHRKMTELEVLSNIHMHLITQKTRLRECHQQFHPQQPMMALRSRQPTK